MLTPEDTYMVRRVPMYPGTLVELPRSALSRDELKGKWVHYAEVHGVGQFPLDMLRYDWASPVNFTFDGKDRHGSPLPLHNPSFGFTGLVIATVGATQKARWTPERWRSFMWHIKPMHTERITLA
jgi:hypothetical protein